MSPTCQHGGTFVPSSGGVQTPNLKEEQMKKVATAVLDIFSVRYLKCKGESTRWFKYDRDKL